MIYIKDLILAYDLISIKIEKQEKLESLFFFLNKVFKYKFLQHVNNAIFISFTILTRCSIFIKGSFPKAIVEYHTGLSGTQDLSGSK